MPFFRGGGYFASVILNYKKKKHETKQHLIRLGLSLLLALNRGSGVSPVGSVHGGGEERSRGLRYGSTAACELNSDELGPKAANKIRNCWFP